MTGQGGHKQHSCRCIYSEGTDGQHQLMSTWLGHACVVVLRRCGAVSEAGRPCMAVMRCTGLDLPHHGGPHAPARQARLHAKSVGQDSLAQASFRLQLHVAGLQVLSCVPRRARDSVCNLGVYALRLCEWSVHERVRACRLQTSRGFRGGRPSARARL